MIRFGTPAARIVLDGTDDQTRFRAELALAVREARKATLNGALLRSAEQLRHELRTLVFTPDRLAVVKGAPATRRAYLDRSLGRLFPARASLPVEYAAAVGQRNAALRRLAAGLSTTEALTPWTETVVSLGEDLVRARAQAIELLAPPFAAIAGRLGLEAATVAYDEVAPTRDDFEARLARDIERGLTGIGPHLHDVDLHADGRELRSFASQGEQRVAVLSLVLAEAEAIASRSGSTPLVLLDDVLSELDEDRRRALAGIVETLGQTVLTATSATLLPVEPAQSLAVSSGTIRNA
jgi:DNA replication and repair protein RecF